MSSPRPTDEKQPRKAGSSALSSWPVVVLVLGPIFAAMIVILAVAVTAAILLILVAKAEKAGDLKNKVEMVSAGGAALTSIPSAMSGAFYVGFAIFFAVLFTKMFALAISSSKDLSILLENKRRELIFHAHLSFIAGGLSGTIYGVIQFAASGKFGETEWHGVVGAGIAVAFVLFVLLRRESKKQDERPRPSKWLQFWIYQTRKFWIVVEKHLDYQREIELRPSAIYKPAKKPLTRKNISSTRKSGSLSRRNAVATAEEIKKAERENRAGLDRQRPNLCKTNLGDYALVRGSEITCYKDFEAATLARNKRVDKDLCSIAIVHPVPDLLIRSGKILLKPGGRGFERN